MVDEDGDGGRLTKAKLGSGRKVAGKPAKEMQEDKSILLRD
jgi:hypothetical protein